MQTATQPRPISYHFEDLPSFTRAEVQLWNWFCRVAPDHRDWQASVADIFSHLVERPLGLQLKLIQSHMVDPEFGEKSLAFGSKKEVSIGRAPESDVVLPAKAISSRHARLSVVDDQAFIEDLGGKLGTYLADKRLSPHVPQPLLDGDQFSIFPYRFRVALEQGWAAEKNVVLGKCRVHMLRRREFIAMSPAGWKLFVVNPHPTGDRAVLDVDPSLVTELRQRILGAAGIEKSNRGVPSDDAILGFVLLSLLERANRTLEFPVQFSFGRGDPKSLADGTRGVVLTSAVSVGGLTGYFRLFLPLRFLSTCMPESAAKPEASYPSGLSWKFPISAGYVDLLSPEMEQIGIGDILVTEDEAQVLFPNDFNKSWHLSPDSGNPERFLLDNYFERGLPVQGSNGEAAERNKPDIESLPLRLHVIVGEKEFTIAEVQSLNPGTVVELDTNKSDPVRLMVNGKVLGEGELVEVEGKLAVKVLGWRSA